MNLAMITFEQVCMLFLLIFIGFVCAKSGVIKPEGKKILSNLLVYIIVPGMVINAYMTEYDPEILPNLLLSYGLSFIALILASVLSVLFTRGIKSNNRAILRFGCAFSNAGYMGFPLIQALYGAEGLMYASAFITLFNIMVWTVGYSMVSGTAKPKEVLKTIAKNPVIYSVVIGLLIYMLQIPVPNVLKQPIALVGNMNTPISMIIVGIIIAGSNLKHIVVNKEIWYTFLVRMLLIPAITFGLFFLLGVSGMVTNVVVIQASCPTAAITSVFAVQFGHDEETAAGAVILTTLLSVLTLPVMVMLLQLLR